MASLRALVWIAMLGCGRIGFEPESAPADAACQFGPWGTPMHIAAPSSDAEDWGGQVTADGLAIYFASSRDGDFDFYVARRSDRASEFGSAQRIDELSSAESENDLTLTPDELEVYFSVTMGSSLCMFHATRATPTGMFGVAERLDALCGTEGAAGGFITADGHSLYYNTVTDGSDPQGTIMVATRGSLAELFTSGTPIPALVGGEPKGFPALAYDGLTLYFESGSPHRLYQSVRPDPASPFENPALVPDIEATGARDEDVSLTADGLEMVFSSTRAPSQGGDDLFVATRACL